MRRRLLAAASNPADSLWEIGGAKHSEGYRTTPGVYVDNVSAFFQAQLAG